MVEYKKTDNYKNFKKHSFNKKFKKVPKDKNAPKKPLTPFFLFSMEMRPQLLKEDPSLSIQVLGKKMGELWHKLPEEDKAKYVQQREQKMEEYKQARAEYEQSQEFKDYQELKANWYEAKKRASRKQRYQPY